MMNYRVKFHFLKYDPNISFIFSAGSDTRYNQDIGNSNAYYTQGWDFKRYCQLYQADCYKRLQAELHYNGYYATHVWVCCCLWFLGKI